MDTISGLLKYQESVIESVEQENSKWKDGTADFDIDRHLADAKKYCQKLLQMQQDVKLIQDKTASMKKRALKLQSEKEKEALDMEQRRERRQEKDKKLSPVIRITTSSSNSTSAASSSSLSATYRPQ